MRVMFLLFIVIVQDSLLAQNFFPLSHQNSHQYKREYKYNSIIYPFTYPVIPTTDTMIINGNTYMKFGGYFYYYDQLNQKLYTWINNAVKLSVDFNLPANSKQWMVFDGKMAFFKSKGQTIKDLFGMPRSVYRMEFDTSSFYYVEKQTTYHFEFTQDIGFTYYYYRYYFNDGVTTPVHTYEILTLFSAIVDTNIFNTQHLDISILTPLTDRRIGNFPFNLHCSLNITNLEFLKDLYTEVKLIKSDTVYNTYSFPISKFTYEGIIDLDGTVLDTGDVIKIKAIASDSTMLNTIVSDPDTGYYSFKVLPDSLTPVEIVKNEIPEQFLVKQNYPNPFNPSTTINYALPELSTIQITITNILGEVVEQSKIDIKGSGYYSYDWNAAGYPSGIYLFNITAHSLISGNTVSKAIKMGYMK